MYELFIWAALFVWLAGVPHALRWLRLPLPKSLWPAYCAAPFAFFGARLLNVMLFASPAEKLTNAGFGAFTLYGGLILGAGAILLLIKALRLPARRYFDAIAPLCGLSIAVMRIGCITAGCCFGIPTQLPWAITPPYGGAAHSFQLATGQIGTVFGLPAPPLPIHPTQAYELIAALLAAAVAVVLIKKRAKNGVPAAAFGLTLSALRLVIFFFRAFPDETELSILFRGPVLFGVSVVFFAGILVWLLKYDKNSPLKTNET